MRPVLQLLRSQIFLPLLLALLANSAALGQIPSAAHKYRKLIRSQVTLIWGMDRANAVIPIMAGQIHAESYWNPEARSPYAAGLTQFTPSTAEWINTLDAELAAIRNILDPRWAVRAQNIYMRRLWLVFDDVECPDERWAFALGSYNAGLGWLTREKNHSGSTTYFNVAEFSCGKTSPRKRGDAACHETSNYTRKILLGVKGRVALRDIYKDF